MNKNLVFQTFDCQTRNRQQTSLMMAMRKLGYNTRMWNANMRSIQDVYDEVSPASVFVHANTFRSPEFQFCDKTQDSKIFVYKDTIGEIIESNGDLSVSEAAFDDAYGSGVYNSMYASDMLMVSSYKTVAVVNRLRQTVAKYTRDCKIRVFGSVPIPTVEFCGQVSAKEIGHVFASTTKYVHCAPTIDDMVYIAHKYRLKIELADEGCDRTMFNPGLTYDDTAQQLSEFLQ